MKITRLDLPPMILGESPLWHPDENAFYWVDGLRPALFRMHWASRLVERQILPDTVGSITLCADGAILLAFSRRIGRLRFGAEPETVAAPGLLPPGVRFNDSKVDPEGRLLAGTMDLGESAPIGAAYLFSEDGACRMVDPGYTVFNGPAWSSDGRVLYMSDSAGMAVCRVDYDPASGTLGRKRPFITLAEEDGLPDGATVDADGRYWQARNGAGILAVHDADGDLRDAVILPTANLTSLAFGGPDLDSLLVTSMNRRLPWQGGLDVQAGSVFLIEDLDARGRPEPRARLVPSIKETHA
ncbi:SMP-30/gluconolactonase/LRE family protein [Ensifer soli]|uniref:SMP-30/gluconolactonase/LRE family protein n=1 Tax=Ciceribacter sp. sgz301302 TaxID=3342379 RepID=UPI0035B75A2E